MVLYNIVFVQKGDGSVDTLPRSSSEDVPLQMIFSRNRCAVVCRIRFYAVYLN